MPNQQEAMDGKKSVTKSHGTKVFRRSKVEILEGESREQLC